MKSWTALSGVIIAVGTATAALAGSPDKPCTAEPKEKWMSLEAIERIVTEHGYTVAKSKMKGTCAEVYARDNVGTRIELFIDPATGNPVGADWKSGAKPGSQS